MKIIAIRHLPTKLNLTGLLQGRSDISISTENIDDSEIRENLKIIQSFPDAKVFVSPLKRTQETANHYGFSEFLIDDRLIEFDFGKYENQKRTLMLEEVGDVWMDKFTQIMLGESFSELQVRINSFLNSNKDEECVVLFAHGVVIRYLMAFSGLIDLDLTNRLKVKNNSINVLSFL